MGRALQGTSNHAAPPSTAISLPNTSEAKNYPYEVDPLWGKCALPSDNYAIKEPLELMSSQRRFTRRDLNPWAYGCIGFFTKVWLCEAAPNNWSEAVLFPLCKKGDKRICSNYRGIGLIDVAAKRRPLQKIPIREGPAHSP